MLPQLIPQRSGGSRKCRTSSVRWETTAFLGVYMKGENVIILVFFKKKSAGFAVESLNLCIVPG